ncbi:tripartite tricarboxylate transporter TctB family protein [Modicisalibacter luteus]|uniref:tripartite tricarboxylate transporter TctB family protein n=1 Tax=Modicisalibacter luteus TaxID=453962 RepID=UPI003644982E
MSFIPITKSKRLVFPLFLLAFCLLYFISSISLGVPLEDGRLTPAFFPLTLGVISTAFAVIFLVRTIRKTHNEEGSEPPERAGRKEHRKAASFFRHRCYHYIHYSFPAVGYFLSSLFYVFSIIVIFSDFKKIFTKSTLTTAVVILGYLLFEQVFRVRLPALWG